MSGDAEQVKARARSAWDAAAEAWHLRAERLSQWLDPAGETMLDLAEVGPGIRLLDLAAGAGGQTLLAARRVGPSGTVVATDLAPNMVAYIEERVRAENLSQVRAQVMDGENLTFGESTFDAVTCRLGLMLFPNPERALSEMHRVVRPGGKVAVMVISTPEQNGYLAIPSAILFRHAQVPLPAPGQPGLFALARPGALQDLFGNAGFRTVHTRVVKAVLRAPTPRDALEFLVEVGGAYQPLLARLNEVQRQAALAETAQALATFDGPAGFEGPCEFIIAVGTK